MSVGPAALGRRDVAACKAEPISCRRKHIADAHLEDARPNSRRSWQIDARCPVCGHGGFAITAGDQGPYPPRHIWHCNCHRCHPADIRAALIRRGVNEGCLGNYARRMSQSSSEDIDIIKMRAALAAVLSDPNIRALADLKLRVAEVIWGEAPTDWFGFLEFAERAGVQRSKRYEAAARWGRRNGGVSDRK